MSSTLSFAVGKFNFVQTPVINWIRIIYKQKLIFVEIFSLLMTIWNSPPVGLF